MATVKTIEDYKKDYEAARLAGDAAGMQAANDGANALRASMGLAPEYATEDIAKIAAQSSATAYTPLNATSAELINKDAYDAAAQAQQQYIYANPTAATPLTQEEMAAYSAITDNVVRTGYYTQDAAAAQAAADMYGVAVTPTSYNGQSGWYLVDRADRTTQEGSSGADEGLLSDADYAVIQSLKQDYADAQARYNAAVAAGDTAAAAEAQQAMDDAHLQAERIRANYNYSGGADGSMYIDYLVNALNGNMDINTLATYRQLLAKGLIDPMPEWEPSSYGSSGVYSSGVPSASGLTGYVNDYSAYLEQMYAAQKAAALAQLQNAYEQNLNAINRAGEGIDAAYQNARNETAGASELAKRNFAEYAAAAGLNSGTGGQAELARSVTLQNNLNGLNGEEAQAIADLELQRANAETNYNNAIAQAEAEGDYQLAAALYQEKVRYDNAMIAALNQEYQNALAQYQLEYQAQRDLVSDSQWQQSFDLSQQQWADSFAFQQQQYADSLAQQQYLNAFQQQQYADSLAQQQYQNAFQQQQYADSLTQSQQSALANYGSLFLKQGIMPSDAMLAAMGITAQDAQSYIAVLQAQQAVSTGSGSSGSSSGSSGSSSGSSSGGTTGTSAAGIGTADYEVLFAAAQASGYPKSFIANNYKLYGFTSSSGLYDGYTAWAERKSAQTLKYADLSAAAKNISDLIDSDLTTDYSQVLALILQLSDENERNYLLNQLRSLL